MVRYICSMGRLWSEMRLIYLSVGLLLCASIAGCGGVGRPVAAPASQARSSTAINAKATPRATASGVNALIKAGAGGALVNPTPTADVVSKRHVAGPLLCVKQRIQQVTKGDVLPQNPCS